MTYRMFPRSVLFKGCGQWDRRHYGPRVPLLRLWTNVDRICSEWFEDRLVAVCAVVLPLRSHACSGYDWRWDTGSLRLEWIALSYCNILNCRVYNNKNFLRQSLHAQYNGMERIGDHAWRDRSRVQRDVRFCCCCYLFRNLFIYLLTCLPRFYWTKFKYNPYNGIFVIMCKDIWNESSFEMQAVSSLEEQYLSHWIS